MIRMKDGRQRITIFCMLQTHPVVRFLTRHSVRCMEHCLHLAAKHFVEAIAPPSAQALRKKIRTALEETGNELDLEKLDGILNDDHNSEGGSEIDEGDESDEDEFTSGDALGKALALVNQVCMRLHSSVSLNRKQL